MWSSQNYSILGCRYFNYCLKEKFALEETIKAQRGKYSCAFTLTSALDGGGWLTPLPDRFTPGKETQYPLYRRMGGPQGQSGRVRKISPHTGIRSPDRPARSESLYRLINHCFTYHNLPLTVCVKPRPSCLSLCLSAFLPRVSVLFVLE
jgi:hypothetical protein